MLDAIRAISRNNMASPHAHFFGHTLRDDLDGAATGIRKSGFKAFIPAANF